MNGMSYERLKVTFSLSQGWLLIAGSTVLHHNEAALSFHLNFYQSQP